MLAENRKGEQAKCVRCNRNIDLLRGFYKFKDGTPMTMCKNCLTAHIDPDDESTFMWVLEMVDVPYVKSEWQKVCTDEMRKKGPLKYTGMGVFGHYFGNMKLKQFKPYTFADSEELNKKDEGFSGGDEINDTFSKRLAEADEMYKNGQMSEAEYKTFQSVSVQRNQELLDALKNIDGVGGTNAYREENFVKESDIPDPAEGLTNEDKIYLATKWGRLYTPAELVQLEQKYTEMERSFNIEDSDTIGSLILICKTYLKMNQALDTGDIETYNKLARTYDSMRKSCKFTASQNKEESQQTYSSVSEIVAFCEKYGDAIPPHQISAPLDIIDKIISDLQAYTRSLIYEDKTLGAEIEKYLRKREIIERKRLDDKKAKEQGLEAVQITSNDQLEFYQNIAAQREADEMMMNALKGGEPL